MVEHAVDLATQGELLADLQQEWGLERPHGGLTSGELAMLVEPWTTEDGQPAFYRQVAQASEVHTDDVEPDVEPEALTAELVRWTESVRTV